MVFPRGRGILASRKTDAVTNEGKDFVVSLSVKHEQGLDCDNTYELYIDQEKKESENLEDDWAFLAPNEIADPKDAVPDTV